MPGGALFDIADERLGGRRGRRAFRHLADLLNRARPKCTLVCVLQRPGDLET